MGHLCFFRIKRAERDATGQVLLVAAAGSRHLVLIGHVHYRFDGLIGLVKKLTNQLLAGPAQKAQLLPASQMPQRAR